MKKLLVMTLSIFAFAAPSFAEDNGAFCARMEAEDKLEGKTAADCECVYGQADIHLTPEMKTVLMENHEQGESGENMMRKMLELGDINTLASKMEAYGSAIDTNCAIN